MNKYEIIGIVGEGAYGVVYKAKHKETGEFGRFLRSPHFSYSCYQEIQGVRWRWDSKEDYYAWSKDAKDAETQ